MQIISQGNNYIVQFDLYSDLTNIANNVIGNLTYNNTQLTLVSMTVTPTIGTQSTLNTNQYLFGTVLPNKHYTVACVFTVLQESNLIPITWTISTSNPETTLANNSKTINLVDYLDGLLASDICANLQGCVVTARTRFLEVLPSGEWLWENYNPANNAQLSTFTTPASGAQIITSADSSITVVGSDLSVTHTVNPDGSVTLNDGTVISAPIPETITTIVNNGNGTATYTNEAGIPITFPIGGVTAVDNSDGTYTLTLADGSTVTISDTSTSTMVNNLDGTYTYTDETGVTTTFSTIDVTTTVTNTVAGNKIADYTNELGVVVAINETVSTVLNNGNGTVTFTNEAGATVTFPIGGVSIIDNADGTYTVTLADGNVVTIGDTSISTLVDNLDGTYTYTNEAGVVTTFDTTGVITTITNTVSGNKIADYTNEAGAVVPINETITSFAAITDGYQYVSENGTVYPFTFIFDNTTPSAPQLLVQLGGITQATIPLNSYDVNINTTGGFILNPLTDEITITETDGETHTIDLSYLKTTLTSTDGSVEIVPSINPDGSTNYDLGVKANTFGIQAISYTGTELPVNPGVNIGDTHTDEFDGGVVVRYTWDGTDWVVGFVDSVSTAQRPWIKVGNTNETSATDVLKTDDVYHMGSVGIGQVAPAKILDVNGDALVNGLTVGRGGSDNLYNTAIGFEVLLNNSTGFNNTASGLRAMQSNTTGGYNTANGTNSLRSNTTGYYNTANGMDALYNNTTGNYNTANGAGTLVSNTTGNDNTASGLQALFSNTTGSSNLALGLNSGRFIANGSANTITDNSVYLGVDSRAFADNQSNQIVIGHTAIGGGSNTATIGNPSVTVLYLAGSVGWFQGNGTPEGAVAAPVGSFYSRKDGGANTSFYVKESGSGNTGWIGK